MQTILKLKLHFNDRIGIVADVANLIAENGFNILAMEVVRENNKADVYLEAQKNIKTFSREEIFEMFGKITGLLEIKFIKTLPQEERENRFKVVLDNIKEGIISIDLDGKITTINKIARKMLNGDNHELIGKELRELNLPDYKILECLKGKEFNNVKKSFINDRGRFQFFATGRPIVDSSKSIIGAVEICKDMKEIEQLVHSISQPKQITFSDFIGASPAIKEVISFAQQIAGTDSVISIRGASGTGKELLACAIHSESGRKGPFIPINCAALPEPLLESELFGYVGGAFTGARKEGKMGLFETANNGTIFLDEIAEMPIGSQARILRVIQEHYVRKIGGTKEIPINTRIITATNRNLDQFVKDKLFREDLYYRINVLPIHIPPLKERSDDILILVEHFLFQLASKLGKNVQSLSKEAYNKLYHHNWPGNVRELKNVIERAAILCNSDHIAADHILFSFEIEKKMKGIKTVVTFEKVEHYSLQSLIASYEKQIISETLESSDSIRKAAKKLDVTHTTLLNKIKKHALTWKKMINQ